MLIRLAVTDEGIPQLAKHLPNVAEKSLLHLDDDGLPILGTVVKPGDILVGIARSTRTLNEGELEAAKLGLHYAGNDDLWRNDAILSKTSGRIKKITRNIYYGPESHPLKWLLSCSELPVGTLLEEVEIELVTG